MGVSRSEKKPLVALALLPIANRAEGSCAYVTGVCLDGEREAGADPGCPSICAQTLLARTSDGGSKDLPGPQEEEIGLVHLWMGYGSSAELRRINAAGTCYPSTDSLISVTGGVLPGHGAESDGNCRCHLERLENGQWLWM